jgi:prevent-host-death family protein
MEVSMRELNQQTTQVLARVEQGETVIVTKNGSPIAVIRPYGAGDEPVYAFRTDAMGSELDDIPTFHGPADLGANPAHLQGFGE